MQECLSNFNFNIFFTPRSFVISYFCNHLVRKSVSVEEEGLETENGDWESTVWANEKEGLIEETKEAGTPSSSKDVVRLENGRTRNYWKELQNLLKRGGMSPNRGDNKLGHILDFSHCPIEKASIIIILLIYCVFAKETYRRRSTMEYLNEFDILLFLRGSLIWGIGLFVSRYASKKLLMPLYTSMVAKKNKVEKFAADIWKLAYYTFVTTVLIQYCLQKGFISIYITYTLCGFLWFYPSFNLKSFWKSPTQNTLYMFPSGSFLDLVEMTRQ